MQHKPITLLLVLALSLLTLSSALAHSTTTAPDPDDGIAAETAAACAADEATCQAASLADLEYAYSHLPVEFTCDALADAAYWFANDGTELAESDYCTSAGLLPAISIPGYTVLTALTVPADLSSGQAVCIVGSGDLMLLPDDGSASQFLPGTARDGYTCAQVPTTGVVALVAAE